jgi:hypothetical protein
MTDMLTEKYGMLASVATIVFMFAVMLGYPSLGPAAVGAMLVVNGAIMADVVRSD